MVPVFLGNLPGRWAAVRHAPWCGRRARRPAQQPGPAAPAPDVARASRSSPSGAAPSTFASVDRRGRRCLPSPGDHPSRSSACRAQSRRRPCTPARSAHRAGHLPGPALRIADTSWVTVSWVATASARIVESTTRQRQAPHAPVSSIAPSSTSRRPGAGPASSRSVQPSTPATSAGQPHVGQRRPDRHLPPHIKPDLTSSPPCRFLEAPSAGLGRRRHPGGQDRPAFPPQARRSESASSAVPEHLGPVHGPERKRVSRQDQLPAHAAAWQLLPASPLKVPRRDPITPDARTARPARQ